MIDNNTNAARAFYQAIRTFSERTQPWEIAIFYETKPDERFDITLVSQRVYGNRFEFLAVMAAAGLDMVDQPLPQKRIVLPTISQLFTIKRKVGFESDPDKRKDFAPTWLRR